MCEFLISENQFLVSENRFLISENQHKFLISENHFLISENNFWYQKIIFWYQKLGTIFLYQKFMYFLISEIRFSDIRNYLLISEIIFWHQKLRFLTSENNFWYQKIGFLISENHFLISENKSYLAFHSLGMLPLINPHPVIRGLWGSGRHENCHYLKKKLNLVLCFHAILKNVAWCHSWIFLYSVGELKINYFEFNENCT